MVDDRHRVVAAELDVGRGELDGTRQPRRVDQLVGERSELREIAANEAPLGIELGRDYPLPVVMHDEAREKTLARYAVVKER